MKSLEIIKTIQKQTKHLINTRQNKYEIEAYSQYPEKIAEEMVSKNATDIAFEVTERTIKKALSKINVKPTIIELTIDPIKYLELTTKEMKESLPEDIRVEHEKSNGNNFNQNLELKYQGYIIDGQWFIGTKTTEDDNKELTRFFDNIVNLIESEKDVEQIRDYISYGFHKAVKSQYVFVESNKFNNILNTTNKIVLNGEESNISSCLGDITHI